MKSQKFAITALLFALIKCTWQVDRHEKLLLVDKVLGTNDFEVAITSAVSYLSERVTASVESEAYCEVCSILFQILIWFCKLPINESILREGALVGSLAACVLLQLEKPDVCLGAIELNINYVLYIFKNKEDLDGKTVCSIVFQGWNICPTGSPKWALNIPEKDPTKIVTVNNPGNDLKIIHLTDLHIDDLYREGSDSICCRPLCCRQFQNSSNLKTAGGKWGSYNSCDMPPNSFDNLMKQIKRQMGSFDLNNTICYFTGDIAPHDVWIQEKKQKYKKIYKEINRKFQETFKGIKLFPCIGNHDVYPVNVFTPSYIDDPNLSTQWAFDFLAKEWSSWLPQETQEIIRKGGYYTVEVNPNFRIISINSNVCYTFNWWLVYDNEDPFEQLKWLIETLLLAESKNQFVHILAHIPPGDPQCLGAWSHQFYRIIERFADIIKGQYNGHSHFDEFRVFYSSKDPDKVINVAYNGASFTTFTDLNPSYKILNVDGNNYSMLDYEEWSYKIDDVKEEPDWYLLYKFKEAYGLENLLPESINGLIKNMSANKTLLQQYYKFKYRDATPFMDKICDQKCLDTMLCDIVTPDITDTKKCAELTNF